MPEPDRYAGTHHLTSLRNVVSGVVLPFDEFGRELVKSLNLLFLGREGLFKVLVFLQQRLNRVQRIAHVFVSQESL